MQGIFEKIYIINLSRRPERKALMIKRLKYHQLLNKTVFIEAVDGSDALVDWYLFQVDLDKKKGAIALQLGRIGCFLSHLKALRQMVADGCDKAIIMEDDAMLHKNFLEKYRLLVKNIPEDTPLLMLCHYISDREGIVPLLDKDDVVVPGEQCWSTVCYQVTREYALAALEAYDKPFGYLKMDSFSLSAELITTRWREITKKIALMVKVPLVIEDSRSTDIREAQELEWHKQYFSQFGKENYT